MTVPANYGTEYRPTIYPHNFTRKCIDNTKNKHIHSSSVRGLNHHCSNHG